MNNRQCEQHPTHLCIYYCPDASCRTSLCELCFSGHTPSHQDKIMKLSDIQAEIMTKIETKAQMKLGSLLKEKCQFICEKSFHDLTQQNSIDFDKEDLVDLVADTAIHKLFSQLADETNPENAKNKKIEEEKKVNEEQSTTKKSGQRLFIAGGYNVETHDDFPEYKYWSDKELKALYGSDYIFPQVDNEVQAFYVKSQNKVVLSSRLYKVFCVKDLRNKSAPPTFFRIASDNTDFSSYHVLDFPGKIILLVTLKNKLLVYDLKVTGSQQGFEQDFEEENQGEEDEENFEEDIDEGEFEDEFEGQDVWACAGYSKDPRQKVHKNIKATIQNVSIAKQFTLADGFRIIGSDDKDQLAIGEDRTKVSIYKLTHEDGTFKLSMKHKIELSSYYSQVTIDDINNLILVYRSPDLLVYKEENNKLSLLTEVNGLKDRTHRNGYNYNKYNQMLIMDNHKLCKFSNDSFTHLKNLPKIDWPMMTRKGVLGRTNKNEISFLPLSNLELDAKVQIPLPDPKPAFELLKKRQIFLDETAKKDTPRCVKIKMLDDNEDELLIYVDASMSYGRKDESGGNGNEEENDIILTNQFIYAYKY